MKTLRTFHRAIPVLATLLSGLLPAAAQGPVPSVRVSGSGFTVQTLREGGAAFGNRAYVWGGVPAALQGWRFTQTDGGRAATLNHSEFLLLEYVPGDTLRPALDARGQDRDAGDFAEAIDLGLQMVGALA